MRRRRSFSARVSFGLVGGWERECTAGTAERWERILKAVRERVDSFGRRLRTNYIMSGLEGVCRNVVTCVVTGGVDYEEIFVFLLVQCRARQTSI